MRLDMELEFDKYCKVGGSPKTVLPSPRPRSKVEKRSTKGKPDCRNNRLSLEENFKEINFRRYRSTSCKNVPSRISGLDENALVKRDSVYQSSREVRKMKKSEDVEGRKKIELSGNCSITSSLDIVDSLCSSDEDNVATSEGISKTPSNSVVEREKIEDSKFRCDRIVGPINDRNVLGEREGALALNKSLSAKLAIPHSPSQSESDSSIPSSPKSRFSPIRKMLDPFTKSKSQRSPLGSTSLSSGLPPARPSITRRSNTMRKSLLNDFSNTSQSPQFGSQFVKQDHSNSDVSCSPAHLHGCLKLENKHGVPLFEFSSKFPNDVFVARTWKADNAANWVYTFHSFHNRRKSNARGRGLKDWNKESSSMVGQMQVSCYLCTEIKDAGDFDNSMVTEFVLNDVVRAKQTLDVAKPPKVSNQSSLGGTCELDNAQQKHAPENTHFDLSNSHPWAATDLHPSLEMAAIVIQVPFVKKESLKYKGGDAKSDQPRPNLLVRPLAEQRKEGIPDYSSPKKVNVVIPSGNHSLPANESRGPSPLLDRWRLGGGCECGGWDMACPLTVFGNLNIQSAENQLPLELFIQGAKENTPALTMTVIEEGQYSVDFHARLTPLQAFSICVAILHCTEASAAVRWERDKQLLQCNSLRVFIEEEVKNLIDVVTEEEERKVRKKTEEIPPPSFKLNPPFSPIGRV